ncbi:hypothetical protein B0A55_00104 [Friedmanniomyces simplex]|uniref:DUF202 domain-containing protein n=1 Tax=Friedmanniomyces simplex TaxID=329884 RepID=A0A4U0Y328_9PEZI|nr:hypothetical protein B0A55_00104 [Friedmanniomyces simplex]
MPVALPSVVPDRSPSQPSGGLKTTASTIPQPEQAHFRDDVGTVPDPPDANERTFLGYLRTSLGLSMLGITVAQLYRLQHSSNPNPTLGYFILSKPIAGIFQCSAICMTLLGAIRFYRQQQAMSVGKVHAGGWEILTVIGLVFLIYTDEGQLVWFGPNVTANNFKWQLFDKEPTLSYWSGVSSNGVNTGHGYSNVTLLDSGYNVRYVVCPNLDLTIPGNETFDCQADLHECYLTDRNTIFITAYNATQTDLTAVNGTSDGWVFDYLSFEIDPKTGKVLFRWSALEHVPVADSHELLAATGNASVLYDWFHINSVINVGDHFLVNSRHTWTVYYLDSEGRIDWRLAGDTGGDFGELPTEGTFRWQHHPRAHNVTESAFDPSLFNNNNQALDNSSSHPTSALVYRLPFQPTNTTSSQAQLLRHLTNDPPLFADSQGSYTPDLSTRNQLATFRQIPLIKEYGPTTDGSDVRWTGRAGPDNGTQIYRGFKEVWHATPAATAPSLAVLPRDESAGGVHAAEGYYGYVSWNGATDVSGWNIYVSEGGRGGVKKAGEAGFRGFETRFEVPCWATGVQVGAVVDGSEVRRSDEVAVGG